MSSYNSFSILENDSDSEASYLKEALTDTEKEAQSPSFVTKCEKSFGKKIKPSSFSRSDDPERPKVKKKKIPLRRNSIKANLNEFFV